MRNVQHHLTHQELEVAVGGAELEGLHKVLAPRAVDLACIWTVQFRSP